MTAMAHNLGLVLRKLLGTGKVRQFRTLCAGIFVPLCRMRCPIAGLELLFTQLRAPHRRLIAGTTKYVADVELFNGLLTGDNLLAHHIRKGAGSIPRACVNVRG